MSFAFICVFTLAFLGVLLRTKAANAAFFNLSRYDNSPPGGVPCMEVLPDSRAKHRLRFVPLKESRLVGGIEGPLADLSLSQKYSFTKKQSSKPLEVLYRFPLPGDAAVKGASVRFGDVEIKTSLKEREEAETEYKRQRARGDRRPS